MIRLSRVFTITGGVLFQYEDVYYFLDSSNGIHFLPAAVAEIIVNSRSAVPTGRCLEFSPEEVLTFYTRDCKSTRLFTDILRPDKRSTKIFVDAFYMVKDDFIRDSSRGVYKFSDGKDHGIELTIEDHSIRSYKTCDPFPIQKSKYYNVYLQDGIRYIGLGVAG